jgi:GNAT superfamily N-acetyltransferase
MSGPRDYRSADVLKDGTKVLVRSITPLDRTGIIEAFKTLDREAIYRRFFSPKKELTDAELDQLTEVDFSSVTALVATTTTGEGERLVGGARYAIDPTHPRAAELAFLTSERYRGRGVAGLLLKHLERLAEGAGISQFSAEVLAENQPMLTVFRKSGLPMRQTRDGGVVHVTLSL